MESSIKLTPIAVVQDRYQGVYAGGAWLAIANATMMVGNQRRIDHVLDEDTELGPWGSDVAAIKFWTDPPDWISVGATPDEALKILLDAGSRL
jgi:hypothetical protein